jgi:hypothetical protein
MLLLTIGYGAACLAGQDEDGTLALMAVLPVRRHAILLQKASAMALQACCWRPCHRLRRCRAWLPDRRRSRW